MSAGPLYQPTDVGLWPEYRHRGQFDVTYVFYSADRAWSYCLEPQVFFNLREDFRPGVTANRAAILRFRRVLGSRGPGCAVDGALLFRPWRDRSGIVH